MAIVKINKKKEAEPELTAAESLMVLNDVLSADELSILAKAVRKARRNPVDWVFMKNYLSKY